MDEMGKNLGVLSRRTVQETNGNGASPQRVLIPEKRFQWGTRVALPGAVLVCFGSLFAFAARDAIWQGKPVRVVPVIVREGGGMSSSAVVQAPGWIEAAPFAVAVSALADGVVSEVLVLEGERVEAGQVVTRMVDDDARLALDRARAEVAQREAELRSANAGLQAAQQDWEHPIERQRSVETADAMVAMNRAELARLPAEIAAQAALVEELSAEYERVSQVHKEQSAANIELIRAKQQHQAQEANLTAVRGREPILKARIRQLEAEWEAARESFRLRIPEIRALEEGRAGVARSVAELSRAKTMLAEAELQLSRMEVRAPVGGIVLTRLVEPGSKLSLEMNEQRSAQAIRLYDPRRLQVRVDIPLADAAKVGVGQAAEVKVDVLPDRVFAGTVSRLVQEADIQKNTVQVKVALTDPAPELKPEMLARARFLKVVADQPGSTTERVFAPANLLKMEGQQALAWIADQENHVAIARKVSLGGTKVDGWVEVVEGLHPGDRLIVADPGSLRDGERIRIVGEAGVGGGFMGDHDDGAH
ncbi:MAG: efflux RND transporter periplasmic adaptor subunit [Planctomycetota bacterium]